MRVRRYLFIRYTRIFLVFYSTIYPLFSWNVDKDALRRRKFYIWRHLYASAQIRERVLARGIFARASYLPPINAVESISRVISRVERGEWFFSKISHRDYFIITRSRLYKRKDETRVTGSTTKEKKEEKKKKQRETISVPGSLRIRTASRCNLQNFHGRHEIEARNPLVRQAQTRPRLLQFSLNEI